MPPVNIYTSRERVKPLDGILDGLRECIARELSCKDRTLASDEISLRVLVPEASRQIADTELEIFAHHYPERVERQDAICLSVQNYVQAQCPEAGSVYAWLSLGELGHSSRK